MSPESAETLAPPARPLGPITGRFIGWALLVNLVLTVALFWPILTAGGSTVVSQPGNDITGYFGYVRTFGFQHLRETGRIPFWNPNVFCGTPYFANPQASVLYPLSLLHLIPSPALAINLFVAVHFCLTGMFSAMFARGRGLSQVAALFSGAVVPLTGGYFMHVYVGHLGFLTFCWSPLVLLAVDAIVRDGPRRWVLVGAVAVAMSILGDHPQITYYTGLVAGIYLLVQLRACRRKLRAVLLFAAMYALGAGLSAAQLVPTLLASRDYVRAGGISYDFATSGSLTPESLLLLLVPRLFGIWHETPYAGRFVPWEFAIYCGTAVFLLAVVGAARRSENRTVLFTMAAICLVLAFGSYLPTFRVLYKLVPLLDHFRIPARFKVFLDLFLAVLAGQALDLLLTDPRARRIALITSASVAVILLAGGLWLSHDAAQAPAGHWAAFERPFADARDLFVPKGTYTDPAIVAQSGAFAARQARWSAAAAGLLAAAIAVALRWPRALYAVALVALVDVFLVTRSFCIGGPVAAGYPTAWRQVQDRVPADQRVLTADLPRSNRAMLRGADDAYGYDPLVLRRYAEFLAFTQEQDPDTVQLTPTIRHGHPLFQLLRVRYLLARPLDPLIVGYAHPLPQALLVGQSQVLASRDRQFSVLSDPTFDPTQKVLLETPPDPVPVASDNPGTASVVRQTSDELEIKATVRSPSILLITDAYAPGWTATPIQSNPSQPTYDVLPADYTLRGIPLATGEHHFLLRYRPPGLTAGVVLTALSLGVFAGWSWRLRSRRRRPDQFPTATPI